MPKQSCGIIPAVTEVQHFSLTTASRLGSSFRDLMWAEKLPDTTDEDDEDDDDDDDSVISGAVLHGLITTGSVIYTRRVRADLTPICLFEHVAPQPGTGPEAPAAEQISLRRLSFELDGADARGARRRDVEARWAVYLKRQGRSNEKQAAEVIARQLQPGHRWMGRRRRPRPLRVRSSWLSPLCCRRQSDLPSSWETSEGGLFPLWLVHVNFRDVYDAGPGSGGFITKDAEGNKSCLSWSRVLHISCWKCQQSKQSGQQDLPRCCSAVIQLFSTPSACCGKPFIFTAVADLAADGRCTG